MSLVNRAIVAAESIPFPDFMSRAAIEYMVGRTRRHLSSGDAADDGLFVREMMDRPIAIHTDAANAQHYEVPAAFFALVLGPHRKYSSCLFRTPDASLEQAERAALEETARNARLADGQDILELGCGWGSLSLFMAAAYPAARITAVSNSHSQRAYIMGQAESRGLSNLRVITADMNEFKIGETFDRIVSVEMFEHMSNWRSLLSRTRGWLKPGGRLFLHVFSHRTGSYKFDENDRSDWIAQHFFTGGIMPSHSLIRQFSDIYSLEHEARWNGTHYRRTADAWLDNFDAHRDEVEQVLKPVYGKETALWMRRWRLFFLATSGLFGHAGGDEWGVSHYLLRPAEA